MISKAAKGPSEFNKIGESLNSTKQSSPGFSPSCVLFGIERSAGNASHIKSDLPDLNEKIDLMRDRKIAFERLLKNAEKQNDKL